MNGRFRILIWFLILIQVFTTSILARELKQVKIRLKLTEAMVLEVVNMMATGVTYIEQTRDYFDYTLKLREYYDKSLEEQN